MSQNSSIKVSQLHLIKDYIDKTAGNVQPDWNETDTTAQDYIKNKPTSMPASDVKDWAKADTKPSYAWDEINNKPETFTPSAHTHTKSEITDFSHTHTKSEITDFPTSMPASDVYDWAKAETKPSYTASEVGLGNVNNTSDADKPVSTAQQEALNKKVDKVDGQGLSTNDYTTDEKNKLGSISSGAEVNVQSNWTETDTSSDAYILNKPTLATIATSGKYDDIIDKPSINDGKLNIYQAASTTSNIGSFSANSADSINAYIDAYTKAEVDKKITDLPEPMVFRGTLGTGGTISSLPAAKENEGDTYKVITEGTYASQFAKIGDTFISDGEIWNLIPSGDEPSGTVTNVNIENGDGISVSGGPITSSGTITISNAGVRGVTQATDRKILVDTNGTITTITIPDTASSATTAGIAATATYDSSGNKIADTYYKASNPNKYTDNIGTITGITMNNISMGTSGTVNLGTVITAHQDISGKADKTSLATVATSGLYKDLSDKPTIPSALSDLTTDSTHRVVTDTQITSWDNKSSFDGKYTSLTDIPETFTPSAHNHTKSEISDFPTSMPASDVYAWAKAATKPSYDYSEITNSPTIPTVNNGTLTIQKNGSTVTTFTANSSSNVTANIGVPTSVSELKNDSNYTSNIGTITGITMNGSSMGTSGTVNLGTIITAHQDISDKMDKENPTGTGSISVGKETNAIGNNSQAFGYGTLSSGGMSHAEGANTTAAAAYSHAEGLYTYAGSYAAHAEGHATSAIGFGDNASHSEGTATYAYGTGAHAEGWFTSADGDAAHAAGIGTTAMTHEYVLGIGNEPVSNRAMIVGGGSFDLQTKKITERKNIFELDWDGNITMPGTLTLLNTSDDTYTTYSNTKINYVYIEGGNSYSRNLSFPKKTGTIALTSDIPTVPTALSGFTDDVVSGHYLPLSGGNLTGALTIGDTSIPDMTIFRDGSISIWNSATDSHTITIPSKDGTFALTSDIPTNISSLTNDSGYITSGDSCASATKAEQDGDGNVIVSTYYKLSGLGGTTFKTTRMTSKTTNDAGYWAAMCNSSSAGSPSLPSSSAWWHILSMDWNGDTTNWISQLALPTQNGGVPHYRRNEESGTSIDSSTWHSFITDENIVDGYLGGLTVHTYDLTTPSSTSSTTIATIDSGKVIYGIFGVIQTNYNQIYPVPFYYSSTVYASFNYNMSSGDISMTVSQSMYTGKSLHLVVLTN